MDYVHLERTTGKAIADAIVKSLHDMGFDIENLRGQGYDGASAMSSSIQGVNGRIREIAPLALYSHCKSHVLNLSIASSCKQMNIRNMISFLNEVYLFFANSPKRQMFLGKILDRTENASSKRKLQGLCKTRWAERHTCYETFHELYLSITVTLDAMLRPHEYAAFLMTRCGHGIQTLEPRPKAFTQHSYHLSLSCHSLSQRVALNRYVQ